MGVEQRPCVNVSVAASAYRVDGRLNDVITDAVYIIMSVEVKKSTG